MDVSKSVLKSDVILQKLLSSLDVEYPTVRNFPCLDELRCLLRKSCTPSEVRQIVDYVREQQSNLPSLVKELQVISNENPRANTSDDDLNSPFEYYDFVLKLLARGEVERQLEHRLGLRERKFLDGSNSKRQTRNHNDSNSNIEQALELIECLTAASRGVEPPRDCFIKLAKNLVDLNGDTNDILENALLIEEHVLEILKPHLTYKKKCEIGLLPPWVQLHEENRRYLPTPGSKHEGIAKLHVGDQMRCAQIIHEIFTNTMKEERRNGDETKISLRGWKNDKVYADHRNDSSGRLRRQSKTKVMKRMKCLHSRVGDEMKRDSSSSEYESSGKEE